MIARWLGLPSAMLLLASTQFIIDAYPLSFAAGLG
jgi:hypothetical protein